MKKRNEIAKMLLDLFQLHRVPCPYELERCQNVLGMYYLHEFPIYLLCAQLQHLFRFDQQEKL